MKIVIREDGQYLVKDLQDYSLKKHIESNIIGRTYSFGYDVPFSAFAPIAKYDNFVVGLKTYPNKFSTPFYTQGIYFEAPFMLHMIDDYLEKIDEFLTVASTWKNREKEYRSIVPPTDDVMLENISESPVMLTMPPNFIQFKNDYFSRLHDFEMYITPVVNKIKTNRKTVEEYVDSIDDFIYAFSAKEFLSIEKPICGIPDITFDYMPETIEIPVPPGSIFAYVDTIDMGPRKAYRVFRIEPKVYGAIDFEIFLIQFMKNQKKIVSSLRKLTDIIEPGIREKVQERLHDFSEYYLEMASVAIENDEIGALEDSLKNIPKGNSFITITESGVSIWSKIENCHQAKTEIEEIEDSITLDFIS